MNYLKVQELLTSLNPDQQRAINIGTGVVAVSAVPGSGKTKTLIARIARLIKDGLDPQYILAMTFTRAAALEMNNRLDALSISGCRVGTIHSLCYEFLRSECEWMSQLKLDDTGYVLPMELKKVISNLKKRKEIPNRSVDLQGVEKYILQCKSTGDCYSFGDVFNTNRVAIGRQIGLGEKHFESTGLGGDQSFLVFKEFENRRAALAMYSYDDMILWTWALLLACPDKLRRWQQKYSLIMVDEAMDSSGVQWDISFLLAGGDSFIRTGETNPKNLMAFFDLAQSIYAWRSAHPEIALQFAKAEGTLQLTMPLNYRSTPEICKVASYFVEGEEWHLAGEIKPASGAPCTLEGLASSFKVTCEPNAMKEACSILDQCQELNAQGTPLRNVAILARLAGFLHLAEIECIRRKIPYEKRCSGSFIDSREAQDILAYLRVAIGADPEGVWLKRTIYRPFKYIGKDSLILADDTSKRKGINFLDALFENYALSQRQRRSLLELKDLLDDLKVYVSQGQKADYCIKKVLTRTQYEEYLREEDGALTPDAGKTAILEQLMYMGGLFESVREFIIFADTLTASMKANKGVYRVNPENTQMTDWLILSTIHSSKGLEYEHVFLADVSVGRFPWNHCHSMDEEKRLMYVAITRAKKECRVSYTHGVFGDEGESSLLLHLQDCLDRLERELLSTSKKDIKPTTSTKSIEAAL